jgi:hypothetical protein
MLRRVALVRTEVSEELSASSETSIRTRATRRNMPEDPILHSHRRENLKSYINVKIIEIHSLRKMLLRIWFHSEGAFRRRSTGLAKYIYTDECQA